VRPTFTDWDKLKPGEILCDECAFWFEEQSDDLARRVGKEKPQRMRNYSHFVVNGQWTPLSKGDKKRMQEILLGTPFPELAAIAESGQKHIVFRATRNAPGSTSGWVQFEEQSIYVQPDVLHSVLTMIEALYVAFSKSEIETGRYAGYRIVKFGLDEWRTLEDQIKPLRGGLLFKLAVFLAQRRDDVGRNAHDGCRSADGDLAGDTGGLQEPLPDDHLAAVRGSNSERSVHVEPGQIHQLSLFEAGC
jgi:hypothetical protein